MLAGVSGDVSVQRTAWLTAFTAALACAGVARAEFSETALNRFGRWTSWGWSEGYHAYDECPRCAGQRPAAPAVLRPQARTHGGPGQVPTAPYLRWQPLMSGEGLRGKYFRPTPAGKAVPPPSIEEIQPIPTPVPESTDETPSPSDNPRTGRQLMPMLRPTDSERPFPTRFGASRIPVAR
jgi:hypothetical protein